MSIAAFGELGAIMSQLASTLDRYEADSARMVGTWFDMDLYSEVSAEIDEIQRYSVSLPGISVAAAALLIAHSELVYTLWRNADVQDVQREHTACIESLRKACRHRLAPANG